MNPFKFLMAAPDATQKVPQEKIAATYKWRQAGVLFSAVVGYIGYYIIRLIFTTEQNDIMKAYHFTTADIGLVLACFGVGYGISKLFMGALSDKSNPRYYLAAGLMGSAILNLFLGSTRNLYVMMFLMILISVTQGMGAPAAQKLIQLWWGKKWRGTVYAVWSSAHNAGAFACVAIVEFSILMFSHSIAAIFYTASAVSAVIAILIAILGANRPATVGLPSIAEYTGEVTVLQDGETVEGDTTQQSIWFVFRHYILNNKIVWAITLTSMSLYLVRYGVMSWIPSYLHQFKGFDASWAKWLVGIFELAAVPGVIILGAVSDFLKGKRALVCIVSVLALIGCLTVYFTATNHAVIVFVLILMSTLIYAPLTLVGLMVNEAVPKFAVGSSTGFMGFFQYLAGEVAATALIGILVAHFGWTASNTVLYSAASLAFALLILIMVWQKQAIQKAAHEHLI
ncbi:MFS transporter [Leuconostoc falkenbergense]|uniref:MFS transporter n=1 Tax=Leuconostoc falkenbergense TaxID=2766470 RepID=UPI00196885E6|nr:MFS transporter [Leuconostoc falkenbergense]QSB52135.1 MFS transporter [Leuconostoc falkenbergense]